VKKLALFTAVAGMLISHVTATVTLQFGDSGFLGENTTLTSGITWGIVVDTGGDGFDTWTGGFAVWDGTILGGSDDDTLYLGDFTTFNGTNPGTITNLSGAAAAPSKAFGVIWFESKISEAANVGDAFVAQAGDLYGFTTNVTPSTTPSDGTTVSYDAIPGGDGTTNIALVPEPSALILTGLGSLLLLRRRRSE